MIIHLAENPKTNGVNSGAESAEQSLLTVVSAGLHSIRQFNREQILSLLSLASSLDGREESITALNRSLVASLFLEPSTRTLLSFTSAALQLGGHVVALDGQRSRIANGESIEDTIAVMSRTSDVLVIRTPISGGTLQLQAHSHCPIINAGDGTNEHPTQALGDLLTIWREFGRLDGLHIALVNDARSGRSLHSLALALSEFDVNVRVISPRGFELPDEIASSFGGRLKQTSELDLSGCDAVFVHPSPDHWLADSQLDSGWIGLPPINQAVLSQANNGVILLHPGSIGQELDGGWRDWPQQRIFEQVSNGTLARAAIFILIAQARRATKVAKARRHLRALL